MNGSGPGLPGGVLTREDALSVSQILFSLRGRISRKTWWLYGVLGTVLASLMLYLLLGIAGFDEDTSRSVPNLLTLWLMIATSAKRWHDRDRSGWWVLLYLVPAIGALWAIIDNGFVRGTPGPNRFGPDPTERV